MSTAARPGRAAKHAILIAIILVATALRVLPWLANYPLHRDEALYGYWARLIASGQDPLLLTPWIDKPPLSIYLTAGSLAALGDSELALRMPGMVAAVLTVAATYALARRAYGEHTARLAAGLLALSPFAILFAPTAFTDPWLTLWLVVAAWAARVPRRGLVAGLAVGLAVASKQQGLLVAPLVIGLLLIPPRPKDLSAHSTGAAHLPPVAGARAASLRIGAQRPERLRQLGAAILGCALILAPLTWWDSLRWHNRPSFWDRSLATYGHLGLAAPADWPARAVEWAGQLGYLFGLPVVSWLMLGLAAGVAIGAAAALLRRQQLDQPRWLDLIFGAYVIGYLALHIVVTFQPWDRYLLPLTPLACLLAARGLRGVFQGLGPVFDPRCGSVGDRPQPGGAIFRWGAALALLAVLGYAAWLGAAGRIPVGSDHGAYAGVRQVADIVRSQPARAILYHRSLGWYFDFYLFDAPQERRWYDTADKLADEAAQTAAGRPRWLIATDREVAEMEALRPALAARGLALAAAGTVHRPDGSRSFALYRIVSQAAGGEP